jgi:hypothetical protein
MGTRRVGARLLARPAHRLQLLHGVRGGQLIDLIKAWTEAEESPDQAILEVASNPYRLWPWNSNDEFAARVAEADPDHS